MTRKDDERVRVKAPVKPDGPEKTRRTYRKPRLRKLGLLRRNTRLSF